MQNKKKYGYVAYIDEAGDPGVKTVKPIDSNGASEWLVLAATVIRVDFESDVPTWGREFLSQCGGRQQKHFHFRNANAQNKLLACERLSALHVRNFVVCSKKKNMRGHKNSLAAKRNIDLAANPHNANWFYFWVTRVLMEKVTNFVAWHSLKEHGEIKKIKFEFSQRGGIRYEELKGYFQVLQENDQLGSQTVTYDTINWRDKYERGHPCLPVQAMRLAPRMAIRHDNQKSKSAGFGVKLMPRQKIAQLEPDQQQIFKFYGYKFN